MGIKDILTFGKERQKYLTLLKCQHEGSAPCQPQVGKLVTNILQALSFYANKKHCLSKLKIVCALCVLLHTPVLLFVVHSPFKSIECQQEHNCWGHLVFSTPLRQIISIPWIFSSFFPPEVYSKFIYIYIIYYIQLIYIYIYIHIQDIPIFIHLYIYICIYMYVCMCISWMCSSLIPLFSWSVQLILYIYIHIYKGFYLSKRTQVFDRNILLRLHDIPHIFSVPSFHTISDLKTSLLISRVFQRDVLKPEVVAWHRIFRLKCIIYIVIISSLLTWQE